MTENEIELIHMINSHNNPEKALEIAIGIILEFLEQDESSQEQRAVSPSVSA